MAKKKSNWVTRLKTTVQMVLKGSKYYTGKHAKKNKPITRKEEIKQTRLSGRTKKQLSYLSDADYKAVMGILKGRKK